MQFQKKTNFACTKYSICSSAKPCLRAEGNYSNYPGKKNCRCGWDHKLCTSLSATVEALTHFLLNSGREVRWTQGFLSFACGVEPWKQWARLCKRWDLLQNPSIIITLSNFRVVQKNVKYLSINTLHLWCRTIDGYLLYNYDFVFLLKCLIISIVIFWLIKQDIISNTYIQKNNPIWL